MQIRSFNEFSAEMTKSLMTSSSPCQVFRSLPLNPYDPTPLPSTHIIGPEEQEQTYANQMNKHQKLTPLNQTLGLLARLRIVGCYDAKCASADLATLQLQMFCFHLLPQVHHRKANKGQDLHSTF